MPLSRSSLELFAQLLPQVTLNPLDDNLVGFAHQVVTARTELIDALNTPEPAPEQVVTPEAAVPLVDQPVVPEREAAPETVDPPSVPA